ncbi:MAG: vapC3 [Actinomycetia bacterium]|jgi:predicted nucleic acid-binding protein|nr:vapC3 [Actinomycetes bacterium]
MFVVDASIVIRLLTNRREDELLRQRLARTVHAPALIDAEVSSVIRGFTLTTKPNVQIVKERAEEMLIDYAGLRIVRHPMQPLQGRVFDLRHNFTAYDGMYVALAEALDLPLLTDDGKFAGAPGHRAAIQHYPN